MATKKKRKVVKKKQKPTAPKKRRGVSSSKPVPRRKAVAKSRAGEKPRNRLRGKGKTSKASKKRLPASKKRKPAVSKPGKRSRIASSAKPNPRLTTLQKSLIGPAVNARNLGLSANPAHKVNKDGSIDVQLRIGNFGKGPGSEKELSKFIARFGKSAGPIRYRGVRANAQLFMKPEVAKKGAPDPSYLRMVGSLPSINLQYRRLDRVPGMLAGLQSAYRSAMANGWEVMFVTVNLRYDPDWT